MSLYEQVLAAHETNDWTEVTNFIEQHFTQTDRPLVFALLENNIEKAKLAHASGACINVASLNPMVQKTIRVIIEILLQFDYAEILLWWLDKEADLQLHANELMLDAVSRGSIKIVQLLLQTGKATSSYRDRDLERTAFLHAIANGQLITAQWLIDQGYSKITEESGSENAVTLAVEFGDLDMLLWLFGQHDFPNNANSLLRETIMHPVEENALQIAKWLVATRGADIHSEFFDDKRTLLLHSALHQRSTIGMWLLSMGANAVKRDVFNLNALQILFMSIERNLDSERGKKQSLLDFGQALLEQGAAINTDLTFVNFDLTEGLLCYPERWILIGAKKNDAPFSYPGAINTIDDLRERISTLPIQQVESLGKAVGYLLTCSPEDKHLIEIKFALKNALNLKQKCLLLFKQHPQALPENYAETVPIELAEEIKRFTQP